MSAAARSSHRRAACPLAMARARCGALARSRRRPCQQDRALAPVQLSCEPSLAGPLRQGQSFVQRRQHLRCRPLRLGQQCQEIGQPRLPPGRPIVGQGPLQLAGSGFRVSPGASAQPRNTLPTATCNVWPSSVATENSSSARSQDAVTVAVELAETSGLEETDAHGQAM